ncbi:SpvB/TcaC N-terminal domain-containing protein [Massilia rubra]|uniref:Insecticidal toxin complex protein n=1 Tax=Massilia rubra TaxID=2607910 RepID=A0ABX0LEY5_9BURK|nr:SpvB/TcaC N-terminal domain-containing protein [Massilia rubra]NHZ33386.1 insecticidal toxin complex protein [Massilia rubra]
MQKQSGGMGHTSGDDLRRMREPAPGSNAAKAPKLEVEPPTLSLPKGGGAISGIDEQFTLNPSNGTAALSLSLPMTPARNGFLPPLKLTYNSGAGNGVLGIGWALDMPSIRRRSDQQLPRYRDDDVFLLQGQELVPAATWQGGRWDTTAVTDGDFTIRRYRVRVESAFARIERIAHPVFGEWWRVTTRHNVSTFFGLDAATRIADPAAAGNVHEWLPALLFDDQGNCLAYDYRDEDLAGVPATLAEANRLAGVARFANKYLKRVRYGNRTPYVADPANPYRPAAMPAAFLFHLVLDYGEHDAAAPVPEVLPGQRWPARADPFSAYRGGFEIRTYRLLRRALMFHQFDELAGGAACLVRSLDLAYVSSSAASPQATDVSYLRHATQCAYVRRDDGSYLRSALPPLALEYQALDWDGAVRTVERATLASLPPGLGDYEWTDLYGEGIPGLFTEREGAWFYTANLGDVDESGRVTLDASRCVMPRPSFSGMREGALALRDLNGDGRQQVVVQTAQMQGYFARGEQGDWLPFRSFDKVLRIDLSSAHVRRLDLDGDGRADLLISEDNAFVWHKGSAQGYDAGERVARPADENLGPAIVFAEELQTIHLADMSGDGLRDIVRIRNNEVCYWPNLGYGRFGPKVAMDNAPAFAAPDQFDARYLHLADVSGTGAIDILYLGPQGCGAWLNLGGNAWSAVQPIAPFLPPGAPVKVDVLDLLGNGTACIVWMSPLPAHAAAPLRYIDLMGGKKPHLLTKVVNNLGKETTFSYKSSTWFYQKDKQDGRPWATRLPFPVHCLRRVEVRDRIAGARRVTEMRYHHGYYDAAEREFHGFGMVEQRDAESFEHWEGDAAQPALEQALHQAPVLTKTWFHTGAISGRDAILLRFRDEYWDRELARQGYAGAADEAALPDAHVVPAPGIAPDAVAPLRPEDWREALRACKGMVLRKEVFGLDAPATNPTPAELRRQLLPYTVAAHNCVIEMLQPALAGEHAVFVVKEREALTWNYERDPVHPRIEHRLNLSMDAYGNVLEAVHVAYGAGAPQPEIAAIQGRTLVTLDQTDFTTDAIDKLHYRLRLPARSSKFELTGVRQSAPLYRLEDFMRTGFHVLADSVEAPFFAYDSTPPAGVIQRRLMSAKETLYYDANVRDALPLAGLHYRALPFASHELAYTAELLAHLFEARVTPALMRAGGYLERGAGRWWVSSGSLAYLDAGEHAAAAQARFFAPVAHLDALGARTAVAYFGTYFLMRSATEDAAHNRVTIDTFDLRTLAPVRMTDVNGNVSTLLLDEMGWVKATAAGGKGGEGDDLAGLSVAPSAADSAARASFLGTADALALEAAGKALLQRASARYVYDAHRYLDSGGTEPPLAASIVREQHAAALADSPVQISFEYSNGMGRVEMRKLQAEPGIATRVTVGADGALVVDQVDSARQSPPRLRWVGSGRRIVNNKGNPVKDYEPFFSLSPRFESERAVAQAGRPILRFYDPADRPVRVNYPDGTFTRTEFSAWRVVEHDRNDTVLDSAWYALRLKRRIDGLLRAAGKDPLREAQAAAQTAAHAGTPLTRHVDPLGRHVLEVAHDGQDGLGNAILHATVHRRDAGGNVVAIRDARNNPSVIYGHDMRGRVALLDSMDSGLRQMLDHAGGEPLRVWDGRGQEFQFAYDDPLHRLTGRRVLGGDGAAPLDHVYERIVYGEGRPDAMARNLRGNVALVYDTAGRVENLAYDFKGNLAASARRLARDYKGVPDWAGADPDAALEAAEYRSGATYDAIDRVAARITADGSEYLPTYNAANLLEQVRIRQGADTLLIVAGMDYDAKGQRLRVVHGNGVVTTCRYDSDTFRLLELDSLAGDGTLLQALHYTYDPVGNATHREDRAVPTVWFANAMVTDLATYRYSPLYRLVEANGRERAAAAAATDNWNDAAYGASLAVGDALAWRNYTQEYRYDSTGNITQMKHSAGAAGWTRDYTYAAGSNRLAATRFGMREVAYAHHAAHGFLTSMPHLTLMAWNFRDELQATATQRVTDGTPETTWYVYDGHGKRIRKIVEGAAAAAAAPARKSERLYLDGVELYRDYGAAAPAVEQSTLDVMDERQRVALIERTGATRLVRYQCADHLQSAQIETDAAGRVISYEQYHPFGTTAWQVADRHIAAAARRYRHAGMERDAESGLEYCHARYYAPWLGRWIAPDHLAERLEGNRYAYVKNNPVKHRDPNGMFEESVHGILTYRLALAAGFPPEDAARVALAAAAMDHDADTKPAGELDIPAFQRIPQTIRYHFPDNPFASAQAGVDGDIGAQRAGARGNDDLERFGQHLHTLEDIGFTDAPGPHMRHDPGRPVQRMLGPSLVFVGLAVATGTLISEPALLQGNGGAALLVGLGIYLMVLGVAVKDIGHPSYRTERGEFSTSFGHTADQAPQDPVRNSAALLQVYEKMKEYARARYGGVATDDAGAAGAITETVSADNACLVSNFANARPLGLGGVPLPSYSEILSTRSADRGRSWLPQQMDVTMPAQRGGWRYTPGIKACH